MYLSVNCANWVSEWLTGNHTRYNCDLPYRIITWLITRLADWVIVDNSFIERYVRNYNRWQLRLFIWVHCGGRGTDSVPGHDPLSSRTTQSRM